MPENEDAETVYLLVRDQYIMSQVGPIAINQLAIHEAMRLYDVHDKQDCFEKVLRLSRHFISKERQQAEIRVKR